MRIVRVLVAAAVALAVFLAAGNLVILGASFLARHTAGDRPALPGVGNFQVVDGRVWRSAAPSLTGYRSLADRGVATIVDLRHDDERGEIPRAELARSGVDVVEIPVRDGQVPAATQVDAFLAAVADSPGPVLVHCGAGVGRTGAMVAAYRAVVGDDTGVDRVRDNLAVGPPSLEQIVFAAATDDGRGRPHGAIVATSRLLDGPRRLWHRLT